MFVPDQKLEASQESGEPVVVHDRVVAPGAVRGPAGVAERETVGPLDTVNVVILKGQLVAPLLYVQPVPVMLEVPIITPVSVVPEREAILETELLKLPPVKPAGAEAVEVSLMPIVLLDRITALPVAGQTGGVTTTLGVQAKLVVKDQSALYALMQ